MVEQGELALDDPISGYLPSSVVVPTCNGQPITLADLATRASGLPLRVPGYLGPPYPMQVQDLYDGLSRSSPSHAPGEQYEGSFLADALLVDILARRAGVDYAELLRERVFEKLGMTNTTYEPSGEQRDRAAVTYNAALQAIPARGRSPGGNRRPDAQRRGPGRVIGNGVFRARRRRHPVPVQHGRIRKRNRIDDRSAGRGASFARKGRPGAIAVDPE